MDCERLFLIGMPYSGKSTWAKYLAKMWAWHFVDMDDEIVKREKKSIPTIFKIHGEAYFRKIEQEVLYESIKYKKTVVATGGGVPCFFDNLTWMKQQGKVVFIKQPLEVLVHRSLQSKQERPLVPTESTVQASEKLSDLWSKRAMFYEQAHQTLLKPTKQTISTITKQLG